MSKSKIIAQGIELIMLNKHEIIEASCNREDYYTFDIYSVEDIGVLRDAGNYPCTHEFDIYAGICDNALVGLNRAQRDMLFRGWGGHTGNPHFPVDGDYERYCRDSDNCMLWLNPRRWELLEHVSKVLKVIKDYEL